jgi:glycosyltransferase involved in cell wall biosynthesis
MLFYLDATEIGGAEQSLATLLASLSDEIEVFVMGVEPIVLNWVSRARPGAVRLLAPRVRNKLHLPAIAAHLRLIRQVRPHVCHISMRTLWSCQYGILAAFLTPGVRVVAVIHSLIPPHSWIQCRFMRLLFRRIDAAVAPGVRVARLAEELIGLEQGSIQVIPNVLPGIDVPSPAERSSAGSTVAFAGRLVPEKGVDVLLRALARLPDVHAMIIGAGPEEHALRLLAEELGIQERVALLGWRDDAVRLVATSAVFVLPSRTEASPVAVLEAMAASIPVVATDVGSVSELVIDGETGLLVQPDDADALAAAIRRLLDDEQLRRRLGRRGRQLAMLRFQPDEAAAAYEELFAAAAQHNPRRLGSALRGAFSSSEREQR